MNASSSADSSPPDDAAPDASHSNVSDAFRYWEIRRIGYNVVLSLIAAGWIVFTWPHFRPAFRWDAGLKVLVLAGFANLCYCAAYPVDLAAQRLASPEIWRRRRWMLWCAGTFFAALLEYYWIADEIYPDVTSVVFTTDVSPKVTAHF